MRRYVLLALLLVGLAWTFWSALTQVESGERGVVMRFGRIVDTVGPGLHVGMPWGIDRVKRVSVDRFREIAIGFTARDSDELDLEIPPGQLLTGDHNLVNIQVVLQYAVDEKEVERFVLYGNEADSLVSRAAETVLAEWVASRGVDEVLLRGNAMLPQVLPAETQRRVAEYGLGVSIGHASVTSLSAPRQVRDAFEAVTRAQNAIQTEENDARKAADDKWTTAQAYAFMLEKDAAVYADGVKKLAVVEADAFHKRLAVLATMRVGNPNYLATLWLEETTKIYTEMRAGGRLDLLDHRLAGDGIDILQIPPGVRKK
jgi:membrane protease subunit HflK